jgi:methyl-accepting chemotaxis protein
MLLYKLLTMQNTFNYKESKKTDIKMETKEIRQATLLSETDVYGTIIFVNDDFCNVAKYSRDQLMGKPHNIIRHPDMPKKLFKVMWDTIMQGRVFRGIIKNRASDGSHYWVRSTIMPILDNNKKVIRYVGVRYHITDDTFAQELYNAQVRQLELNLS